MRRRLRPVVDMRKYCTVDDASGASAQVMLRGKPGCCGGVQATHRHIQIHFFALAGAEGVRTPISERRSRQGEQVLGQVPGQVRSCCNRCSLSGR